MIFITAIAGACGHVHHPFSVTPRDFGPDPIQKTIREETKPLRRDATAHARWEQKKKREYQSENQIERDRDKIGRERRRRAVAMALLQQGPLRLDDCLAYSLEFNDQVQAARSEILQVEGDEKIQHASFLPNLGYELDLDSEKDRFGTDHWQHTRTHLYTISQTLVQFGKEASGDRTVRQNRSNELFGYESTVNSALQDIRTTFFTILMRKQQVAERRKLLAEFQSRYRQIQELEKARRVLEVDVLTARLNVLNEEARINALEAEITRERIDLLHSIGFPVDLADPEFEGELELFDLDVSEAVAIGLRRSSAIAQDRAAVDEQLRIAKQTLWEFVPDMDLEVGQNRNDTSTGFKLSGDDGEFGLSAFGERSVPGGPNNADTDKDELYAQINLEVPIFDGYERKARYEREMAELNELRHRLRDEIDSVEVRIRKAYETLLEERKELEIRAETVAISKERLRVQERLKDLGRISDDALETFRERFFSDQDNYFTQQINVMKAQESVRAAMQYFEPLPLREKDVTATNIIHQVIKPETADTNKPVAKTIVPEEENTVEPTPPESNGEAVEPAPESKASPVTTNRDVPPQSDSGVMMPVPDRSEMVGTKRSVAVSTPDNPVVLDPATLEAMGATDAGARPHRAKESP